MITCNAIFFLFVGGKGGEKEWWYRVGVMHDTMTEPTYTFTTVHSAIIVITYTTKMNVSIVVTIPFAPTISCFPPLSYLILCFDEPPLSVDARAFDLLKLSSYAHTSFLRIRYFILLIVENLKPVNHSFIIYGEVGWIIRSQQTYFNKQYTSVAYTGTSFCTFCVI